MDAEKSLSRLRRSARWKRSPPPPDLQIGPALLDYFRVSIDRTHRRLGQVTDAWLALVPEALSAHTSLSGLSRGTLSVRVDSASHLYALKQALLDGLERRLIDACRGSGVRRISLRVGPA